MGKLYVTEFISLDGVIEDPGGSESHRDGGWSFEFSRGDEGDKFKLDETMGTDVLLLGRKTYEGFADAWPQREGEFADKFNNMPKCVVSTTLTDPEWNNTTVISEDVAAEISKLKEETDGVIGVHGSGRLVQTLLKEGLVDEYRLMVFPVVLGTGQRLFEDDPGGKVPLKLVDSQTVGDGVQILRYEPA